MDARINIRGFRLALPKLAAVGLFLLVTLGCEQAESLTDADYVKRAHKYMGSGEYKAGVIELKNALRLKTTNPEARWLLGKFYLELNNGAAAEKELRQALALKFEEEEIVVPLASALELQGKYRKILEQINPSKISNPQVRAKLHYIRGMANLFLRQKEQALTEFQIANTLDPSGAESMAGQALRSIVLGDNAKAMQQLDLGLKAYPQNQEMWKFKIKLALSLRNTQIAEAAVKQLLSLTPNDPLAQTLQAQVLIQKGKGPEAIPLLKKVVKSNPELRTANELLAITLYTAGKTAEAMDTAENLLKHDPANVDALFIAAAGSYSTGSLERAYHYTNTLLKVDPLHNEGNKLMAAIHLKLKEPEDAATRLKSVKYASADDAVLYSSVSRYLEQDETQTETTRNFKSIADTLLANAQTADGTKDPSSVGKKTAAEQPSPAQIRSTNESIIQSHITANRLDEALKAAQVFIQAAPKDFTAYQYLGAIHAMRREYSEAEEAFRKALEIKPGNPEIVSNYAAVMMLQNHSKDARDLFTKALELNPENLDLLMGLANLEAAAKHWEKAEALTKKAAELHPDILRPHIALGRLYLDKGLPDRALAATRIIALSNPNEPQLLEIQGVAHMQQGKFVEAAQDYQRLTKIRPSAHTFSALSNALERQGKLKEGQQVLSQALELDPKHPPSVFAHARLLTLTGHLDEASAEFQQIEQQFGPSAELAHWQGNVAMGRSKPQEAVQYFKTAFEAQRNNQHLNRLVLALVETGKSAEAQRLLKEWLLEYPQDTLSHGTLANLFLDNREWAKARDEYRSVVQLSPRSAVAHNNLAWCALQLGDGDTALEHAKQASDLEPDNPNIIDTLGLAWLEKKHPEKAMSLYEKLIRLAPNNPDFLVHYARALVDLGKPNEAKQPLEKALSFSLDFAARKEGEKLLEKVKGR